MNQKQRMATHLGKIVTAHIYGPTGPWNTSCEHNGRRKVAKGRAVRLERAEGQWAIELDHGFLVYENEIVSTTPAKVGS